MGALEILFIIIIIIIITVKNEMILWVSLKSASVRQFTGCYSVSAKQFIDS